MDNQTTKMQGTPKNITPKTKAYKIAIKTFKVWLQSLGYSEAVVYSTPKQIKELLWWLENKEVTEIKNLTQKITESFIHYLSNRKNRRRTGGLSIAHINKHISGINLFVKYLKVTAQHKGAVQLKKQKEENIKEYTFLSKEEIQQLYQATDNSLVGIRDRAMLGVYYGCGLRKSEGLALEVSDILFERKLLYVRKPKNYYERYVPVNIKCLQDLESYLYNARPLLINENSKTNALFISERGTALTGGSMICRLISLKQKTKSPILQNKSFGVHALRHSIGTHLLEAGMDLEYIAHFLGHKSLDSTQIYTHLINEE